MIFGNSHWLSAFSQITLIITNEIDLWSATVLESRIANRNTAYQRRSELADSLEEETENEKREERPERVPAAAGKDRRVRFSGTRIGRIARDLRDYL